MSEAEGLQLLEERVAKQRGVGVSAGGEDLLVDALLPGEVVAVVAHEKIKITTGWKRTGRQRGLDP